MDYIIADHIQRVILMPYFLMAWNQKIWDANNCLIKQFQYVLKS